MPAVVPTRYRAGNATLSFFSTIAQFGTAEDIALADLKIELLFPADEFTRAMLLAHAGSDDDVAAQDKELTSEPRQLLMIVIL